MNKTVQADRKIHIKPNGFKLHKDDVWGAYDIEKNKRISDGMIVARSEEKCPIFKNIVPCKSVTVVCNVDQEDEVEYWLSYVHGGDNISDRKELKGGKVALRSDYMCW